MSYSPEANSVLDRLANMPRYAKPTVTRSLLKEILLKSEGRMFLHGRVWPIKSEHLGAGVHSIWLEAPR